MNSTMDTYGRGEVCDILNVDSHILRYWEGRIPFLNPIKNSAGQRMYRDIDVEMLLHFKYLVHSKKYTIEGALHAVEEHDSAHTSEIIRGIRNTRRKLFILLRRLSRDGKKDDSISERNGL